MDARDEASRLVETYTPLIMRIGYTYLHSREDAEDICQETLLKLVRRGEPFADEEHEKAWVVRVAINGCKDLLKSAARQRSVGLEEESVKSTPDGETSDILGAVQALPETYREPIFLHYCEGYKIAEIARITGKSKHAIAKNLSRGRAMLRKTLGGDL
jgi:RNA polymerase sigma factor (sigma-70 family)